MTQETEIVLIGGGGHCKACIDVIELCGQFRITGIVDRPERLGQEVLGYRVVAHDEELDAFGKGWSFLVTVGQIKTAENRRRLFERAEGAGTAACVVSPLAHVSRHARIETGTIVMHGAIIQPDARIGKNCIINTKALIEHDATVGDHCHIATGAVLNGGVQIGEGSFVGSNATLREGVRIGSGAVIGAGAVVLRDVEAGRTVQAGAR